MKVNSILLLIVFFIQGCGIYYPIRKSETKLSYLHVNQTRDEVINKIGQPNAARGEMESNDKSIVHVDEYVMCGKGDSLTAFGLGLITLTFFWWTPICHDENHYFVYYRDGIMEKWGQGADWKPDVTGDITIRNK